MIEVELTDGNVAEFPDEMPQQMIMEILARDFGGGSLSEVLGNTGLQKVGAIMIGTVAAQKAGQMVQQHAPVLKFADVMDEAGMIDLDKAYVLAKDAFQKSGKVSVMGLLLDDGDVEIIHEIAKRYAQ